MTEDKMMVWVYTVHADGFDKLYNVCLQAYKKGKLPESVKEAWKAVLIEPDPIHMVPYVNGIGLMKVTADAINNLNVENCADGVEFLYECRDRLYAVVEESEEGLKVLEAERARQA